MNIEKKAKKSLKSMTKTAKNVARAYAEQSERDLETFLKWAVEDSITSERVRPIAEMIKDMARKFVFNIDIGDQSENLQMVTEYVTAEHEEREKLMETIPEDIKNISPRILRMLTTVKERAMDNVMKFKRSGEEYEAFCEKEIPCKCGTCDLQSKSSKILYSITKDMMDDIMSGKDTDPVKIRKWATQVTEFFDEMSRDTLLKTVNSN